MSRARSFALLAAIGLSFTACSPGADRVVLVSIDTLRADRVGSYGYEGGATPTLDALAASGARFETAISPAPLTLPSHATLLTGLDPHEHGVRHNGVFHLAEDVPTLAERFQASGHSTAAFVGAAVLDRQFGLARGFDHYDDRISSEVANGFAERRADAVVSSALDWLGDAPDRFFLFVHLYDPHVQYAPPEPFRSQFSASPYDGEVAFADHWLGNLLREIDKRWPEGDTIVLVTSDHGESLGEHDELTHAYGVYDATQRVPLLLRGQGVPAGTLVRAPVRLADVAPTLLALAELPPLEDASGRSLLPQVLGQGASPAPAYAETLATQLDFGWSPLYALRTERYKLVRAPRSELYDLQADPGELENLAASEPERLAELEALLDARLASARPIERDDELSPEARARLQSLGYVAGDSVVDDEMVGRVQGADPKDMMHVVRAFDRAMQMQTRGKPREVLAALEELGDESLRIAQLRARAHLSLGQVEQAERAARNAVALEPRSHLAHYLLGFALLGRGERVAARLALERSVELAPEQPLASFTLGHLAESEGQADVAEAHYRRALATRAGSPPAQARLAALYLEAGRADEADALLGDLPSLDRESPDHLLRLAQAEFVAGRDEQAFRRVRSAAHARPDSYPLVRTLGLLHEQRGETTQALRAYQVASELAPQDAMVRDRITALSNN